MGSAAVGSGNDVVELSDLLVRTTPQLHADADAIARALDADTISDDPGAQLLTIQRLQSIWPQLTPTHRSHLRTRTCERLALKEDRFDYLISCKENNSLRLALAWWPTEDPKVQPDEQYCLELGGWLDRYIRWAYRSKCPFAFHAWSGLTILGCAARRNFYFPVGVNGFSYPNLYTFIVGDSGTGKSFAIDAARSVLHTMNDVLVEEASPGTPVILHKTVRVIADSITKAMLEEILKEPARQRHTPISAVDSPSQWETVACLIADEAVSLLGRDMFSVEELIVALTQMYGGKYESNTLSRKTITIPNLSMSLLLGSAMAWLQKTMKDTIFQGGFMGARCLAIERSATIRKYQYPDEPVLDPVEGKELARYLAELARARPRPMRRTKPAQALYEEWYRTPSLEPPDDRAKAYFERRFRPVNKLSMAFSLSREPGDTIELEDVEKAINFMAIEEPMMLSCFTNMVQSSRAHADTEWLRTIIVRSGGHIQRNELTKHLARRMRAREYREVLQGLLESGEIGVRKGKRALGGGVTPDIVYLTEYEDSEGNEIKRVPKLGSKR